MNCPKCKGTLEKKKFGFDDSVELDICSGCEGMWFDRGELDQLDDSVSIDAENVEYESLNAPTCACPRCDGKLESVRPVAMPSLVIEICNSCRGFWLDKNELEDVREMTLKLDSAKVDRAEKEELEGMAARAFLALTAFGWSFPR